MGNFIPVARFKFAYFDAEFVVRFMLSLAIFLLTSSRIQNDSHYFIYAFFALCMMVSYPIFVHLSKNWRKYEQEQRAIAKREFLTAMTLRGRSADLDSALELQTDIETPRY